MDIARLGSRFQLTIPEEICQQLNLQIGEAVNLDIEDGRLVISRRVGDITKAFDLYKATRSVSLEEMDEAIAKGAVESSGCN